MSKERDQIGSKQLKITFFLESLRLGGIGRLTLLLAEGFAAWGDHVELVLIKKKGVYLDQLSPAVKLVNLKAKRLYISINRLGDYLKEAQPDLLISANERANVVALIAKILYKPKTKILISIHTNNTEQLKKQGASLEKRLVLLLARLLYRKADKVVAVSKGVKNDAGKFFRLPAEKVSVIYNPIVSDVIMRNKKVPVEHPWFKEAAGPIILGIGRLAKQKDFIALIDSFAEVIKVISDARLIILGEGEERGLLEKRVADLGLEKSVSMPGYVANPFSYLYSASLFVLSSMWEGFGNVLVEAMAVGTPVVSTDCPSGPAEILENGKYGMLVPVGDRKEMARAIIETLMKPPDKEILIERAMDFTVEKAVASYDIIIKHLLEGRNFNR